MYVCRSEKASLLYQPHGLNNKMCLLRTHQQRKRKDIAHASHTCIPTASAEEENMVIKLSTYK
jgi:hypothetical protein